MTFTPIEELKQFGKRRRLTEADRKRLANYGIKRPKRRDNSPSEISINDMDIKINGAKPGARPATGDDDVALIPTSSQSMLLDRESLGELHAWATGVAEANTSPLLSTSVLPSNADYLSQSQFTSAEFPISNTIALDNTWAFNGITIPNQHEGLIETLPASSPYNSISQPGSLVNSKFTIDDQVIAEQQGLLNIRPTIPESHHIPEKDITARLFLPPRSPTTQSVSSTLRSPWLPRPKCNIQRFADQRPEMASAFLPRTYFNHDSFRYPETDLRPTYTDQQVPSSMKVYGQSIIVGGNVSVEQADESPRSIGRTGKYLGFRCIIL